MMNTNDILLQIKRDANGVVVENMQKLGLKYDVNFGLTTKQLHDIARQIGTNQSLALQLWDISWRETKILALLVADFSLCDFNLLVYWCKNAENSEIADILVKYIHQNCADNSSLANFLVKQDSLITQSIGIKLLSKEIQRRVFSDEDIKNLISRAVALAEFDVFDLKTAVARLLRNILRINMKWKKEIEQIIPILKQSSSYSAKWVAEELITVIEYS